MIRLKTGGDGLWSTRITTVRINHAELELDHDGEFGELKLFFDKGDWNTEADGLIYTDKTFLRIFEIVLSSYSGMTDEALAELDYSEQGMQTKDYVSMDVGPQFIFEWEWLP